MEKKILVVEDDPEDIEFLSLCFNELNFKGVIFLDNVEEAKDYLFQETILPALIVTDCHFKIMTGVEFVQEIRSIEKLSLIKIVALCGGMTKKEEQQMQELGVEKILYKPTSIDELKITVKSIIDLIHRYD